MGRRIGVAGALFAFLVMRSGAANAWYLPEHAEITRKALQYDVPEPLAREIMKVVAIGYSDAIGQRLPFCTADLPLDQLPTEGIGTGSPAALCVPYDSLPALAGDHANDVRDMVSLMTAFTLRCLVPNHTVASMVLGAAKDEWVSFRQHAPVELLRHLDGHPAPGGVTEKVDVGSYDRRKFTRDLDLRLQIVDREYINRAQGSKSHFQDAATSLSVLLRAATTTGDLDNALGQAMAHHIRSIEMATRARHDHSLSGDARRTEALLEHAFALHFVQDAFAAGHMGTEHSLNDSRSRLGRHDFLNRNGIGATRALASKKCGASAHDEPATGDLSTCWRAQGDGYLDLDNLRYVEEATARVQVEFAFALADDPEAIVSELMTTQPCAAWQHSVTKHPNPKSCADSYAEPIVSADPPSTCDAWRVAKLLDPSPEWTLSADRTSLHKISAAGADNLLACVVVALGTIEKNNAYAPSSPPPSAGAPTAAQPGRLTSLALGSPLDPCQPCSAGGCTSSETMSVACTATDEQPPMQTRHGDPDVTLWRPLLTSWPTTQADVSTLEGQRDAFGQGLSSQIAWGVLTHAGLDSSSPAALALEFGVGMSYRLDGILAGRINRPFAELNIGMSPMALSGLDTRFALITYAEARIPLPALLTIGIAWLTKSSAIADDLDIPAGIGPYGVRFYGVVTPADRTFFAGWDVELAYVSLTRAFRVRTASVSSPTETELRLRGGKFDLMGIGRNGPHDVPWSLSLELSGGWAWFL